MATNPRTLREWWQQVALYSSVCAIGVFSILYSNHVGTVTERRVAEAEQKQRNEQAANEIEVRGAYCELLHTIVNGYDAYPATTPAGQNQEKAWRRMLALSDCG